MKKPPPLLTPRIIADLRAGDITSSRKHLGSRNTRDARRRRANCAPIRSRFPGRFMICVAPWEQDWRSSADRATTQRGCGRGSLACCLASSATKPHRYALARPAPGETPRSPSPSFLPTPNAAAERRAIPGPRPAAKWVAVYRKRLLRSCRGPRCAWHPRFRLRAPLGRWPGSRQQGAQPRKGADHRAISAANRKHWARCRERSELRWGSERRALGSPRPAPPAIRPDEAGRGTRRKVRQV